MSQALLALLTAPPSRLARLGAIGRTANRTGIMPASWDNRPTWDNWSKR
jgi:hypothetical protein